MSKKTHKNTEQVNNLYNNIVTLSRNKLFYTKLGLNDTFAHGGSKQYLAKYYGFDAYALINSIEDFIGQKLNIDDKDLETARIEDVHSLSKAEAL